MKRKQFLVLAGIFCAASILALALQDVLQQLILLPLAHAWWLFLLYYRSLPQLMIWAVVVILIALIFFRSLTENKIPSKREQPQANTAPGAVESLALTLEKSQRGVYAKWQIARRLGKLAQNLLIQQKEQTNTKILASMSECNWQPPELVQDYLSAGLTGSFADYPQPRWPFQRRHPTPFDIDIQTVVVFLESQMERYKNNVRKIHPDD